MSGQLAGAPRVLVVDPEREAAMLAAAARTREFGLRLPPYTVLWVRAPDATVLGETVVAAGEVRVYLRDDLGPHRTYETMLHELQHVADVAILGSLGEVAEDRAEAFVVRASQASSRPWQQMISHPVTDCAERAGRERRNHAMPCYYEQYIAAISGRIGGARAAELRRLHHPHHSTCCSSGGLRSAAPSPCRICGTCDCADPRCLELIMFRLSLDRAAG